MITPVVSSNVSTVFYIVINPVFMFYVK